VNCRNCNLADHRRIAQPERFHILKLVERRSGSAPVVITQTHARHILIKTSEIISENEAKTA
jgi:peptidyl-prolyl cis-trans isomerase SurA